MTGQTGIREEPGERGIWGDLKPGQEAVPGLEESLRFTSYSHDPVIGKYFTQARFYDSARGRMLSMDPVKSGLNRYCYCDNDPVNHEDADGEFFQVLANLGVGFTSYFIFNFAGSVVSQLIDGQGINWRQALGEGVNGGITGGTTEGLSRAGSFGLSKVVDKVKRSICSLDVYIPLNIINNRRQPWKS